MTPKANIMLRIVLVSLVMVGVTLGLPQAIKKNNKGRFDTVDWRGWNSESESKEPITNIELVFEVRVN